MLKMCTSCFQLLLLFRSKSTLFLVFSQIKLYKSFEIKPAPLEIRPLTNNFSGGLFVPNNIFSNYDFC